MKKYGRRMLAFLLCIILAFSCMVVPASAFSWTVVLEWLGGADAALGIIERLTNFASGKSDDYTQYLSPDSYLNAVGTRYHVDISVLADLAFDWNQNYAKDVGFGVDVVDVTMDTGEVYSVVMCRFSTGGGGRSGGSRGRMCFADGNGRVLYTDATTETSGRWVSRDKAQKVYQLLPYEDLYNLATDVSGMLRLSGDYYIITGPLGTNVYCNTAGRQFAAIANKDSTAINQDRPMSTTTVTNNTTNNNTTNNTTYNYISNTQVDEGDTFYTYDTTNNTYNTTNETYETIINNIKEGDTYYIKEGDTYKQVVNNYDYSMDIDIENMTMVGEGGVIQNIDNLIYDATTKMYFLDSFFGGGDTYEYNYYTYEYHINYTSVTYIGYTEQYDKHYEIYYQLPDGRDSADLTREDLEQLSTSFKDVMNYARSADDLSQRALYHFDGDTQDSSYWSYCSVFEWAKGASLTYMDEGTFGGSLYLDETEHDFSLTLPANDAAGDWTMQFRYYQSHTESPALDSYISVGGVTLLQFDGSSYYSGSGTAITATSVGSWNELCLMRKDGVVYYYINGVPYSSMAATIATSEIRFYFGSTQQTYKKIDELRFTRGAIYEVGEGYTPSSVPYDSNLSLILPDGKQPLADEVMVFHPGSGNLLDSLGSSDWSNSSVVASLVPYSQITDLEGSKGIQTFYQNMGTNFYYNSSYTSLIPGDSGTLLSCSGTDLTYQYASSTTGLANGLYLPICRTYRYRPNGGSYSHTGLTSYTVDQPYTFSVVLSDGSYSSLTFEIDGDSHGTSAYANSISVLHSDLSSSVSVSSSYFRYYCKVENENRFDYLDRYEYYFYGLFLCPVTTGTSAEIVYMELVEGTEPEWSFSYEAAVYDPGELESSPVLAVRSNTPISTYQIGGVRPSYPVKGQVYAMVENGYITSLQQYTGYAWEAVDGRIWTGSRWIPASSYNVITLQDVYDIVDVTPDYEYIYTESGFWDWFQRAWKDLISRLDKIIEGQKNGSGGSVGSLDPEDDTTLPSVEDDPETAEDEGWGAYDLIVVIKDGTWSIITGVVRTGFNGLVGLAQSFSHVSGFFSAYDAASSSNVLGITNYGGVDIWD